MNTFVNRSDSVNKNKNNNNNKANFVVGKVYVNKLNKLSLIH